MEKYYLEINNLNSRARVEGFQTIGFGDLSFMAHLVTVPFSKLLNLRPNTFLASISPGRFETQLIKGSSRGFIPQITLGKVEEKEGVYLEKLPIKNFHHCSISQYQINQSQQLVNFEIVYEFSLDSGVKQPQPTNLFLHNFYN